MQLQRSSASGWYLLDVDKRDRGVPQRNNLRTSFVPTFFLTLSVSVAMRKAVIQKKGQHSSIQVQQTIVDKLRGWNFNSASWGSPQNRTKSSHRLHHGAGAESEDCTHLLCKFFSLHFPLHPAYCMAMNTDLGSRIVGFSAFLGCVALTLEGSEIGPYYYLPPDIPTSQTSVPLSITSLPPTPRHTYFIAITQQSRTPSSTR